MSPTRSVMRRLLTPALTFASAAAAWSWMRRQRRLADETDAFYRETLDGLGGRVCRYRAGDLTIVYCNDEWAAAFGRPPAQLAGRVITDFLSDDEEQALRGQLPIALRSKMLTGSVATRRAPDGSNVVETWVDRTLDGPDGPEILSIGRDITALARAEAANRFLAENTTDVLMRIGTDRRVNYVTPSVATMLGITPDDVIGAPVDVLIAPGHHDALVETFDRATRTGWPQTVEVEAAATAPGVVVSCELTLSTVLSEDGEVEFHAGLRDVTEIRAAERQFRSLAEETPVPVFTMTTEDGIDYANPAMQRLYGHSADELAGHGWLGYLPPDARAHLAGLAAEAVSSSEQRHLEHRVAIPDAGTRWVATTLRPIDGEHRVIGTIVDLTEQHSREQQLAHEATHDALTGLSNRAHLLDRLDQSLRRAARTGTAPAILFLDLDRFKPVNDRYGHAAGDHVLTTIAERMLSLVRSGDTVARFGGDEFVILAEPPADAGGVDALARRLVDHLGSTIELEDGTSVEVGVSIGVAVAEIGDEPEELVARADAAVYIAKRSGRGRSHRNDAGATPATG